MSSDGFVPLEQIEAARRVGEGIAVRSPLLRLDIDTPYELWLKLENLQPIGAFKLRGAAYGFSLRSGEELAAGVWTSSTGNMALAVSYMARASGVPCSVVMPDTAAAAKVAAVERLGGNPIEVTYEEWWEANITRSYPGLDGPFFHAFADLSMMAGNGVIGLEVLEDLPDVDTVVVPFGGGGLACGIGSAIKHSGSDVRIVGAEFDRLAPLTAALEAGQPVQLEDGPPPSYLGGIGGSIVADEMWPRVQATLDGAAVANESEIMDAIRLLAERANVIAEGAGAAPVAAVMNGTVTGSRIVCVISGGNLDADTFAAILREESL